MAGTAGTSFFGAAIGSEKETNGRARLQKAFLKSSIFFDSNWTSLSSSRQTNPVTIAVVVAIAGMILPAMPLVLWLGGGRVRG